MSVTRPSRAERRRALRRVPGRQVVCGACGLPCGHVGLAELTNGEQRVVGHASCLSQVEDALTRTRVQALGVLVPDAQALFTPPAQSQRPAEPRPTPGGLILP